MVVEQEAKPVEAVSEVHSATPPEQQTPSNELIHERERDGLTPPKPPEQMTGRILDTIV